MTLRDQIVQQAMALSPEDRQYVADLLEGSLATEASPSEGIADASSQEINRRIRADDRGETIAVDLETAVANRQRALESHRETARHWAEWICCKHIFDRCGVRVLSGGRFVLFVNPTLFRPVSEREAEELRIRRFVAANGGEVLAAGVFPDPDDDQQDASTYTLLVTSSRSAQPTIIDGFYNLMNYDPRNTPPPDDPDDEITLVLSH